LAINKSKMGQEMHAIAAKRQASPKTMGGGPKQLTPIQFRASARSCSKAEQK
jgi:hypothetical protein